MKNGIFYFRDTTTGGGSLTGNLKRNRLLAQQPIGPHSPTLPTFPGNPPQSDKEGFSRLETSQSELGDSLLDLHGKRVLIVEDEGITQMQLRRLLTQFGLKVVGSAINGEAGVALALREKPDIILMDISMPVMDGLTATETILQETDTCVVMLTALSDPAFQRRAQRIGACGYILKPVNSFDLLPQLQAAYKLYKQK